MTEEELKKLFETEYLKNTCFDSWDDLMNDHTKANINLPRAMIAVCAKGHWDGMVMMNKLINNSEDILRIQ